MEMKEIDPVDSLLHWYAHHKRDLPWRRTEDPFAIWVSEIMLQQTRVEVVLPYFEEFLKRFPTVAALAGADVEEVLGVWSGLGYYRRARLLHRAAQRVAATGGQLPRSAKRLRELPGIGAYTAAAIGSIAFGLVEPAIDGNVERVVSRYLCIDGDPKRGEARRQIEAAARDLIDEGRPGDSNQALIELGASLCRPRNPLCSTCPLCAGCLAHHRGEVEAFPATQPRPALTRVQRQVAVVRDRGRVLLFRRPETSELLAGMWELPWIESLDQGKTEARLADRYGGHWFVDESLGRVRHSITHRTFDVEVLATRLEVRGVVAEGKEAGWFTARDLQSLPVSSLVKKALAVAAARDSTALAGRE